MSSSAVNPVSRGGQALVALACGTVGLWLAGQHPWSPAVTLVVFCGWLFAAFRWPQAWLWLVPAALPLISLSPWTGWIACDETDLLLLGCLASGYARRVFDSAKAPLPPGARPSRWAISLLPMTLGLWAVIGLIRGWADAGWGGLDPFDPYIGPANSLRVGKSMAYALLAAPLIGMAFRRSQQQAQRLLGIGIVLGLTGVVLASLWERAAFTGLWDFTDTYRVTALFWEMHVGGEAIDAYLALAVPFVGWALMSARRPLLWAVVALLALGVAYVCVATFARGVYGSVLGGIVVAAGLVRLQRSAFDPEQLWSRLQDRMRVPRWRKRAAGVLAVALVLEVGLIAVASSFLSDRFRDSDKDFGSRMKHWTRGIATLQQPADWWLGLGLGRLPSHYAALEAAGEWSGTVRLNNPRAGEAARPYVTVSGPATRPLLAGLYGLTQRVPVWPGAQYRLAMDLRVQRATEVLVQVCERHVLYEGECQHRNLRVWPRTETPGADQPAQPWQHFDIALRGAPLPGGPAWAPRLAMFSFLVGPPGTSVDVQRLQLSGGTGNTQGAEPGRNLDAKSGDSSGGVPHGKPSDSGPLLSNADFSRGMAHWFPAAQYYFLPWHIDNLYLEWLIERGIVGLLLFCLLMATALWRLVFGAARRLPAAPFLAASLSSGCAAGLVGSAMDAPRVAFLLLFLALWSLRLMPESEQELTPEPASKSP